jgi:predicted amidophosphoribosyltransferase
MRNGTKVKHLVKNYTGVVVGKTTLKNLFEDKNNDTEYRVEVEGCQEIRIASENNLEEIYELIPITGSWDNGYSLQLHTLSSTLIGVNEYGHNIYENHYSKVGKLLNQCKYHNDRSAVTKLADEVLKRFRSLSKFDALIPVPPTNKHRMFQPVSEIAKLICQKADIKLQENVFEVKPHPQLKNVIEKEKRMEILKSSICRIREPDVKGKGVLVFDDLFRSGSTLSIICDLLRELSPSRVCVLTLTKTRTSR